MDAINGCYRLSWRERIDFCSGETYPLILKNVNARYAFEIFRPDGTSVIEY